MNRPILLGTTNPYSRDPADALSPRFAGSSGWRLCKMFTEVSGEFTAEDYERIFDRRNLVVGEWDSVVAKKAGRDLIRELTHSDSRNVVVFGNDAWSSLGLSQKRPSPGSFTGFNGSEVYFLPHPSGRNLYYNDKLNQWRTGELLCSLARRYLAGEGQCHSTSTIGTPTSSSRAAAGTRSRRATRTRG